MTPFSEQPAALRSLTALQQEILSLVLNGLTNQEIALRLAITASQVGMQIGRILRRLGLTCRAEITTWAMQQGRSQRRE